jgi:membrane fusion protein (multidrug efflux system)
MVNVFRNFKRKLGKWFWVLLIVLILSTFFFIRSRNKPEPEKTQILKGEVRQELILTGSVNAVKYAALTFPTSGKISYVGVEEGQMVKKGTAISSLDKTVLNTVYQQALNNYRNYQAQADNVLDSVQGHSGDENFTQRAARTNAEVARDNAYDAVKAARYNLANSTIYAPFDGIIAALPYSSPGVNTSLAEVQAVIVDPATIYFDVDADQNDVTSLSLGQSVSIVLDSFPEKEFKGKVTFISFTPKTGTTGTTYKVKVEFNSEAVNSLMARIGMTGDAKFTLASKDNALFLPPDFVKTDIKGKYIKLNDPKNKTYVETGLESEERIEIIGQNFKEGDTVFE